MIAELIEPQDTRWSDFLASARHDFYHLPEYALFSARHEGGTPVAFYARDDDSAFLVPLLLRPLPSHLGAPGDWRDATTPYGYPGPILSPITDTAALEHFLEALRGVATEHNVVTAFFRLHPFFPLPEQLLSRFGTVVNQGQTVHIDLTLSPDEMWGQTRDNHRRGIKKLTAAGFYTQLDNWDFYQEFIDIYHVTMKRVEASAFYFFSDSYFTDLRAALGPRLHLVTVHSPEGNVAAGALFTVSEGIVQYHLGGTADAYLSQAPAKLMFDFARRWAKEAGGSVLHLGGGTGGQADSLFQFKAGFSKLRTDFYTFRVILDEGKNATLVQRRREQCKGAGENANFFPTYRQPCI